uniref:Uncharacterized protein n=1 Tax=Tanacetum cinerariifolium TaxID=118510 RepID=A0A6L2NUP9_TANCI|nr:hypothetical protein [Tanacetum cinerariifolium]
MSIAEAMMVFVSSFYLGKCSLSKPYRGTNQTNDEICQLFYTRTFVRWAYGRRKLSQTLTSPGNDEILLAILYPYLGETVTTSVSIEGRLLDSGGYNRLVPWRGGTVSCLQPVDMMAVYQEGSVTYVQTVLGRAGYDPENEEVKSGDDDTFVVRSFQAEPAMIQRMRRLNQVNMVANKRWLISNLHSSFGDVEVLYHRQECVGLEQLYLSHNSILRIWNAYQCWLTCRVSMFPSISLQQLRIFEKLTWWIDAADHLVNNAGISPAYKLEKFVSYEVKLEFLQHTIWKRVKLDMGQTGVYRKWVKLECIRNFSSIQASSTLIEMGQTENESNRSISARICLLQFAYHSISHGNYKEAKIITT